MLGLARKVPALVKPEPPRYPPVLPNAVFGRMLLALGAARNVPELAIVGVERKVGALTLPRYVWGATIAGF